MTVDNYDEVIKDWLILWNMERSFHKTATIEAANTVVDNDIKWYDQFT